MSLALHIHIARKDFSVGNVRDALSAFNRLISPTHKKVFDEIFKILETGLAKLGTDSGLQTKAVKELIKLSAAAY